MYVFIVLVQAGLYPWSATCPGCDPWLAVVRIFCRHGRIHWKRAVLARVIDSALYWLVELDKRLCFGPVRILAQCDTCSPAKASS